MPVIITFQLIGHSAAKLEHTMSKSLPAWHVIYGQPGGLLPLHPLQNYALIYASWLLSFIFLCVPPARMGKKTFQHMEAFLDSKNFQGEGGVGGWEHNLQLCVRRNMYFRVRLIRPGSTWQKSSPEKHFFLNSIFCPQFSICEISTSQSVQHLPRNKSQTTLRLDYHCGLL